MPCMGDHTSIATRKFRVMNVVVHYGHMAGGYISYSMCRDTRYA